MDGAGGRPDRPDRRERVRGFEPAAAALALAVGGALWLHQAMLHPEPTAPVLLDRLVFLFLLSYIPLELLHGLRARRPGGAGRGRGRTGPAGGGAAAGEREQRVGGRTWRLAGAAVLALLVVVQTALHLDDRAGFLYMTFPWFPVGTGGPADGYVFWLEGHPVYSEAWQFARQAELYSGASTEVITGDHDARAAYAYLGALLARPLGYFGGFVALNALAWYVAVLATWYLARALLGAQAPAFAAALLVACGQGFVFMAGTPMSYVAGYAWGPVLLALAHRWGLFAWRSDWRRWLLWGWACGIAGLFYFTHAVVLGTAWLFGLRRTPVRHLVLATAVALAVPASWYLVGHFLVGLGFKQTTADDLSGQLRWLAQTALRSPLLVASEAGHGSVRALVGGFSVPSLALAVLGVWRAAPRRRQWYLAVGVCGLCPVLVLHMIPVTQRYGYLAYPAVYVAAAEGAWWLAGAAGRGLRRIRACLAPGQASPLPSGTATTSIGWGGAVLALLAAVHLFQANADLWGIYRFALRFGAP